MIEYDDWTHLRLLCVSEWHDGRERTLPECNHCKMNRTVKWSEQRKTRQRLVVSGNRWVTGPKLLTSPIRETTRSHWSTRLLVPLICFKFHNVLISEWDARTEPTVHCLKTDVLHFLDVDTQIVSNTFISWYKSNCIFHWKWLCSCSINVHQMMILIWELNQSNRCRYIPLTLNHIL